MSSGGTCLQGESDIFIHCNANRRVTGTWSEWSSGSYCFETDYHKQRFRDCTNGDRKNEYCGNGTWLDLEPCGTCLKNVTENEDYNLDYSSSFSSSSYSSSSSVSSADGASPRRTRSAIYQQYDLCNMCKTDGVYSGKYSAL